MLSDILWSYAKTLQDQKDLLPGSSVCSIDSYSTHIFSHVGLLQCMADSNIKWPAVAALPAITTTTMDSFIIAFLLKNCWMNSFLRTTEGECLAGFTNMAPQWLLNTSKSWLCPFQQGLHLSSENGGKEVLSVALYSNPRSNLSLCLLFLYTQAYKLLSFLIPLYIIWLPFLWLLLKLRSLSPVLHLHINNSTLVPTFVFILDWLPLGWMKLFLWFLRKGLWLEYSLSPCRLKSVSIISQHPKNSSTRYKIFAFVFFPWTS